MLCLTVQAGCSGRRGLHAHQASQRGRGSLVSETPQGGDGPQGSRPGDLCPHGPGHAEVPEDHTAAGLPQHGEHPHTPAVLHHSQHDAQGEFKRLTLSQSLCSYAQSFIFIFS